MNALKVLNENFEAKNNSFLYYLHEENFFHVGISAGGIGFCRGDGYASGGGHDDCFGRREDPKLDLFCERAFPTDSFQTQDFDGFRALFQVSSRADHRTPSRRGST